MQKDLFERVTGFLLGASWAIMLFGALLTFFFTVSFSIAFALFSALLYIFVSLFFILMLDAFLVHKEKLREMKKQRELLEKIYELQLK